MINFKEQFNVDIFIRVTMTLLNRYNSRVNNTDSVDEKKYYLDKIGVAQHYYNLLLLQGVESFKPTEEIGYKIEKQSLDLHFITFVRLLVEKYGKDYKYVEFITMKYSDLGFGIIESFELAEQEITDGRIIPIPRFKWNIPNYGKLYNYQEFKECCECRGFIDYDGYGFPSNGEKMDMDMRIKPSKFLQGWYGEKFTHVVWLNR